VEVPAAWARATPVRRRAAVIINVVVFFMVFIFIELVILIKKIHYVFIPPIW